MKNYFLFLCSFLFSLSLYGKDPYPRQKGVDALHYYFRFELSEVHDSLKAQAEVTLALEGGRRDFFLDLQGLTQEGRGMQVRSVTLEGRPTDYRQEGGHLHITSRAASFPADTLTFSIRYAGIPEDGMIIGSNRYGDKTFFADNWPDRARQWIPVIDHVSDKATVEFRITAPLRYKVVANGVLKEESVLPEGRRVTHWMETVPLAPKVMVFGAAPFASELAGTVENTPIWSYVFRQNREEGFSDFADALEPFAFYSELIGPYPYGKLANVQSKTRYGGMENAGCIFYHERSVSGKGEMEGLLAHEIAHQWFGNSAGEADWHHIWLSEGFATYLTSVYMEHAYGAERFRRSMLSSRQRVLRAIARKPAPVVDTTVSDLMQLLNAYSYQKGAWVLHMLRYQLGEEIFWEGIREYYHRYRNSTALTSDFRQVMEEVSGLELGWFFRQWLYRSGIPLLNMEWDYNRAGSVLTLQVQQKQEELYRFPLEVTVVYVDGSRSQHVMRVAERREQRSFPLEKAPEEVLFDPGVRLLFSPVSADGQSGEGAF